MEIAGIDSAITIIRDTYAIPHIFAQTEQDAYFALGFVHAQDRSWQMETMRHVGAGRLTEIVGDPQKRWLMLDRIMRTLGIYRYARASLSSLTEEAHQALEAYSAGVNTYWKQHKKALHLAFQFLNYEPEAWKPEDSLVWGKLMSLDLSGNWSEEWMNQSLKGRISAQLYEDMFSVNFEKAPVTLSGESDEHAVQQFVVPLQQWIRSGFASNVWAVAGSHTVTGFPILANESSSRVKNAYCVVFGTSCNA